MLTSLNSFKPFLFLFIFVAVFIPGSADTNLFTKDVLVNDIFRKIDTLKESELKENDKEKIVNLIDTISTKLKNIEDVSTTNFK